MLDLDPITESPSMVPRSRIDLLPLPAHFNAARGILWGVFVGAEFWLALAVIVCVLV